MDNWSSEEMTELRKFWKSEIGKKYIKRMEDTRKQLLQQAMGSVTPDDAFRCVSIANGFDSVVHDIELLLETEEAKKEEAEEKKKK